MHPQWDHKADNDLLLTIIEEASVKSIVWSNISNKMADKGHLFTLEGCRQHFQKIRKQSGMSGSSTPSKAPGPATPKKRNLNATLKQSGKAAQFGANMLTGYDDDDDLPPPSKFLKRKRTDGVKKNEEEEDNGSDFKPKFKEEQLDVKTGYCFKAEATDGDEKHVINLDDDSLYD